MDEAHCKDKFKMISLLKFVRDYGLFIFSAMKLILFRQCDNEINFRVSVFLQKSIEKPFILREFQPILLALCYYRLSTERQV